MHIPFLSFCIKLQQGKNLKLTSMVFFVFSLCTGILSPKVSQNELCFVTNQWFFAWSYESIMSEYWAKLFWLNSCFGFFFLNKVP